MVSRATLRLLAVMVVAMLAAWLVPAGGAHGAFFVVSNPTASPPSIDGVVQPGEWSGAGHVLVAGGVLMVMHDDLRLYMLLDATADPALEPPTGAFGGDFFNMSFDVNRDGLITPNLDVNYGLAQSNGQFGQQKYLGPGTLTGISFAINSFEAVGLGSSPNLASPHVAWEFSYDRTEITNFNSVLARMGFQLQSEIPSFEVLQPANVFTDFSKMLEIAMVPEPATLAVLALGGFALLRRPRP